MRLNKFLAQATGISRRAADTLIREQRIQVDGAVGRLGTQVLPEDKVLLDGKALTLTTPIQTILLNKPAGFVVSRRGQGSKTIYALLPPPLHQLKPIGRLDKESSGLLLLTNDGQLAYELTHPRYQKDKLYQVTLDKPLSPLHHQMINDFGISLTDGSSKLNLERLNKTGRDWLVTMHEGRNRQIRRTFEALNYQVVRLHRTHFGNFSLGSLRSGAYNDISTPPTQT